MESFSVQFLEDEPKHFLSRLCMGKAEEEEAVEMEEEEEEENGHGGVRRKLLKG